MTLPRNFIFAFVSVLFLGQGKQPENPSVVILGTVQDAGYPQIGCKKECCADTRHEPMQARYVSSIALIDPADGGTWLFDATPDITRQLRLLENGSDTSAAQGVSPSADGKSPIVDGVFLTHAHIGHYTGLMYFGREAMNAHRIPVFALPRMKHFLENNGPWRQLTELENIVVQAITPTVPVRVNDRLSVAALIVPHRDEYSETAGYLIRGPSHSLLYIPDIDKWEKWEKSIVELVGQVDYALVDGTFFSEDEIPGRNMDEIPHPFIAESMRTFEALPAPERKKIYFLHFNHTNPVLKAGSKAESEVLNKGFRLASEGTRFGL